MTASKRLSQPAHEARPPFSICVATYNGYQHLREQLLSILDDMRDTDQLIVVDDGSYDGTWELIRELLADMDGQNLKLVQLSRNRGHRIAFATGISVATSPLIALSDQDDIWCPGHLDWLAHTLESTQADLVFASLSTFGDTTQRLQNPDLLLKGWRGLAAFIFLRLTRWSAWSRRFRLYHFGCASAFRSSAINPDLPIRTETHEQWLIAQALVGNGVRFTPQVVTLRRLHVRNLTRPHARKVRVKVTGLWRTCSGMATTMRRARRVAL